MDNVILFTWIGPSSDMPDFKKAMALLKGHLERDLGAECSYSIETLKADAGHSWVVLRTPGVSAEYIRRVLDLISTESPKALGDALRVIFKAPTVVSAEVYEKILEYDPAHNEEWSRRVVRKDNSLENLISLATGQK